eukprot:2922000-Pyramimonas_sp.AAC.1
MDSKGIVHVEDGFVFTDGNGFYTEIPYVRSAGWTVVVYDNERRRIARYVGAVPYDVCPRQVAKCGEDYAMLIVSRQVMGTYTVSSDCEGTLPY